MKNTLLKFLALFFLISCIFVSADTNWIASNNGRNFSLYNVAGVNITGLLCFGNNSCFNASNFSSGGSYSAGLGLNLTGTTFNVNTSFLERYNDTAAIVLIDNRESANNNTQSALISSGVSLQLANNVTQAVLIATLRADNTTQAALINQRVASGSNANLTSINVTNNVTANTFFGSLNWSRLTNIPSFVMDFTGMIQNVNSTILAKTDADNITQGTLIANEVALQAANNLTQATLIANLNTALSSNATRFSADNVTQASLIASQVSLQSANNITQAALITTLRADNTTQAALINLKADSVSPSFTGTARFVNANFTGIIYINNVNYTNSTSYIQANQFLEGGMSLYTKYANITSVIADNTTQATLIDAKLSGTGTSGYIPQFQSGTVLNNSIIYQNNSRVYIYQNNSQNNKWVSIYNDGTDAWIGTDYNVGRVKVQYLDATAILYATGGAAAFQMTGNSYATLATGLVGAGNHLVTGGTSADFAYRTTANHLFSIGAVEAMRINANGSVGIGTAAPTSTLNVVGNVTIGNSTGTYPVLLTVKGDNNKIWGPAIGGVVAELKGNYASGNGLYLGETSANRPTVGAGPNGNYLQFQSGTVGILFTRNDLGAFNGMWANTGNLYIGGATSATGQLDVDNGATAEPIFRALDNGGEVFRIEDGGAIEITGAISLSDAGGSGLFSNPSGGWTWLADGDGHNRLFMPYTASSSTINNNIRIDGHRHAATSDGYGTGLLFAGRDTTTQDAEMVRLSGVWTNATHTNRSAAMVFDTVNNAGSLTEKMRITSTGNVGIATNVPSQKLTVNGSVNITDNLYQGQARTYWNETCLVTASVTSTFAVC